MTLDEPGFAELVIISLAAIPIIGAAWQAMVHHARRDNDRRMR